MSTRATAFLLDLLGRMTLEERVSTITRTILEPRGFQRVTLAVTGRAR